MKGLNVYNRFEKILIKNIELFVGLKIELLTKKMQKSEKCKLNQMPINLCWTKRKD